MKKLGILVLLALVIGILGYMNQEQSEQIVDRRYGTESGIIQYKVSGLKEGTETLYFDNWGAREAKLSMTSMQTPEGPVQEETLTVIKDGKTFQIDLATNTGVVVSSPRILEMSGDSSEEMRAQPGFATGEKLALAGKECDTWKSNNVVATSCLWKSIPLKTTTGATKTLVTTEAIEIQEGASVPEEQFMIPGDIQLTVLNIEELFGATKAAG